MWGLGTVLAGALLPAGAADADERSAKNSVYAEGLGSGLAYSLNYERLVVNDLGVRAGLSYMSVSASASGPGGSSSASSTWMSFPLTASWIGLSSGSHALEIGGGATLVYSSGEASTLGASASASGMTAYGSMLVGYRIQPVDGGFQFRVGFTGLVGTGLGLDVTDPDAIGFLPWGHLSLGGTF